MIELKKYNDRWPGEFQLEVGLIKAVLSEHLICAHHIGSTAIKGCCAKPMIDIIVEVMSLDKVDQNNHPLEKLGYEVKGEFGVVGRRFFMKGDDKRTHHLHVFESGNLDIERHRLFVEYMNAHADQMAKYSKLKMELSQRYRQHPDEYSAGKAAFIKSIDLAAVEWASG
ncbi:MAG: GrpB family protein [Thiotrichaceae bacterium]|nr:GrpB family protein [Thiotrichaceae bacterium]